MLLKINNFLVVVLFLTNSSAAPTQGEDSHYSTPNECKGQSYCTVKPAGYDELEEMMNSALPEFLITNYADRTDDVPWEIFTNAKDNCPYYTKNQQIYQFYHGESRTTTDIIVQTNFFKQFVETVHCAYNKTYIDVDAKVQCLSHVGLNSNLRSSCETSNAVRILYVYDPDKKKIVLKYIEVPASCHCKVYRDDV